MDDNQIQNSKFKIQNEGTVDNSGSQMVNPQFKNSAQMPQSPAQPFIPTQPVGTLQKEQFVSPASEFIKPSEQEPNISPEEKESGVETVSQYPRLSEEHVKIGIKPLGDTVPVSATPSGMVQLLMTQKRTTSILKMHKKVSDSILWLATLILKQVKIINKK